MTTSGDWGRLFERASRPDFPHLNPLPRGEEIDWHPPAGRGESLGANSSRARDRAIASPCGRGRPSGARAGEGNSWLATSERPLHDNEIWLTEVVTSAIVNWLDGRDVWPGLGARRSTIERTGPPSAGAGSQYRYHDDWTRDRAASAYRNLVPQSRRHGLHHRLARQARLVREPDRASGLHLPPKERRDRRPAGAGHADHRSGRAPTTL